MTTRLAEERRTLNYVKKEDEGSKLGDLVMSFHNEAI